MAHNKRCGVSALIYSQGLYNYNNMSLLRLLLQNGGVFFDVGANIGSYTLVASESSRARVFAFEPHPQTFSYLRRNVELNHRENVTLLNIALGSFDGWLPLTDDSGSATNYINPIASDAIPVPCRRADAVSAELRVEPTVAKIDVEGFEYDVLVGFGRFRRNLDLLLVEMNGLADVRSMGQEEVHRLLLEDDLCGPYTCDFDAKTLRRGRWTVEDSVYLSKSFRNTIYGMGFSVEELL